MNKESQEHPEVLAAVETRLESFKKQRLVNAFGLNGVPSGSRTRVIAVKGRCPGPLDDGDVLWQTTYSSTVAVYSFLRQPERVYGARGGN